MSKVIFVISLCGMLFALCFPVEAQQAGLTIPPTVIYQATKVIK